MLYGKYTMLYREILDFHIHGKYGEKNEIGVLLGFVWNDFGFYQRRIGTLGMWRFQYKI
jgi:hypothetical protein